MKTLSILLISLSSFWNVTNDPYRKAMGEAIQEAYQVHDITSCQLVLNKLERIANANSAKWEPGYYLAYSNIMMGAFQIENAKKDTYFDLSITQADKLLASNLTPDVRSEVLAVKGFALMLKLNVDAASRGSVMSEEIFQTYQTALHFNDKNPRAMYLLASMQYGMAQFMGTPTEQACLLNQKAQQYFDAELADSSLYPKWGKEHSMAMLESCK
ncbi:MAG: hypothetical protein OEW75_11570 [Cyclobacteriaceae bacterium]|nr:hypothetical protein [Cyclobacteriaceae bacterium]